jgi:hypothetical protein
MTQVSLGRIPQVLGPAFEAGDAAAEGKERERERLATFRAVVGEMGRPGGSPDAHG